MYKKVARICTISDDLKETLLNRGVPEEKITVIYDWIDENKCLPIERKDNIAQVNIYQAEATLVNGRIRGLITNSQPEDLSGKYLKFDFYSERDVFLGRKFIAINTLQENETQNFEILFKLTDVDYYTVSIVDEKPEGEEIEILPEGWSTSEVVLATAITLLIFW